ncbi:diguanylate cyclase [Oceanospirillum sediminis]|uniref:Diguanylate cyclase n=1 Tax=Oceanospirillum sediminis TaxID=2760088 RepID=A0A839IXU4_9GAMM|nr:diguanylate cyclase [Oceanospirillum sediminis]MBB1489414.1 diguanylate cyclase [Oceanospirillum sediminis]
MTSEAFSSADLELLNSVGKKHSLFRRTLILFFLIIALLSFPLIFFLEKDYQSFITRMEANDHYLLEKMAFQTSSDLKVLMSDIIRLSDFVESGITEHNGSQWIADEFMQFARYRLHYDQLRFIDASGQEKVRIDWDNDGKVSQSASVLQNKAHRYYFSESITLKPGQVYLSEIDFNRENGKIEIPRKMTLRMASPIQSVDGTPKGIVVINYLPGYLFSASGKDKNNELEGRLQIIDSHGHQLIQEADIPSWNIQSDELSDKYQSLIQQSEDRTHSLRQNNLLISVLRVHFNFLNTSLKSTDWFFIRETRLPGRLEVWFSKQGEALLYGSFAGVCLSVLLAFLLARSRRDYLKRNTLRKITHICVSQSPNAIIIADAQQRIVYVNASFSKLMGYRFDEVKGKTPAFLQSGKTPESTYSALWSQLSQDEVWHGEFINQKADGSLFWCKASVSSIYPEGDQNKLYVCIESDITPLKETEEKLKYQATHDPLTGLGNRDYLFTRMEQQLPGSDKACCLVADIDHFKKVNDTYGHNTGDQIIKGVARLITEHARQSDIAVRYGGEEFVVILPGTTEDQALKVAERLRYSVSETLFSSDTTDCSAGIQITISIGCSLYPYPTSEADFERMIHNADQALYEAKNNGRNSVIAYRSDSESTQITSAS